MYTFLSAPGEGEAVGPGEEIPQPDGGEKLPQVLHCHARGERMADPPPHSYSYTLGAPGLTVSVLMVLIILDPRAQHTCCNQTNLKICGSCVFDMST